MKFLSPEFIRAITPLFIAAIAAVIAITVFFSPDLSEAKATAGLGLAGSALTGAAGLAQSSRQGTSL